jgi:hypothetical protein
LKIKYEQSFLRKFKEMKKNSCLQNGCPDVGEMQI